MFTGIIEALAQVKNIFVVGQHVVLELSHSLPQIQSGESIAVEGVCLTAQPMQDDQVKFDVSSETLEKTCLNTLTVGSWVNLERALAVGDRMGGHYVSGHVDKIAKVLSFEPCDNYVKMVVAGFTSMDRRYLISKGSIAINGVSLTINQVHDDAVELMLIPHTLKLTSLQYLKPQQIVNIEFDSMAKIVEHQLKHILSDMQT